MRKLLPGLKYALIVFVILAVFLPVFQVFTPNASIIVEALWRGIATGWILGIVITRI